MEVDQNFELNEEAAAEAADSQAMSMLDLLASLEGSGQTEQGIFSSGILQYSKVSGRSACIFKRVGGWGG